MRRAFFLILSLVFLVLLFPEMSLAGCNDNTGATGPVIKGVSPQVGIAGITNVYINGYCFGTSVGTITLNGEAMNAILIWNDAEIEFELPFDATSGNLVVITTCCGSDSTQYESQFTNRGNNNVDANFEVKTPNNPPLCCNDSVSPPALYVSGSPNPSQYAGGTWTAVNLLTDTSGT